MKRYFAFGDLHGHYRELMSLYDRLLDDGLRSDEDTLVFLGDHIDSGPDSRDVVAQLMEWQHRYPHWVFLQGNHEVMMLNARQAWVEGDAEGFYRWWTQGGEATWGSYLRPGEPEPLNERSPFADIDAEHVAWLARLPLSFETEHFIFVHAGLRPPRALAENNPQDLVWIRDKFIRSHHDWGKRVIYGHTPVNEPLVMANKIGLDTLPRNVGKLTVVELNDDDPRAEPRFRFQPVFNETTRDLL